MFRYKITLAYDGTPFRGWQRQPNTLTVQGSLESALKHFSHDLVTIQGSSRTDTGVHALQQVAHFDLAKQYSNQAILQGLNYWLKDLPVIVTLVESVPLTFNARFSAVSRTYIYRILISHIPAIFARNYVWRLATPLDLELMRQGAKLFLGHHDFSAFRKNCCQAKSPMRTVDDCSVTNNGNLYVFTIKARSFLHSQVRFMVGALTQLGKKEISADGITTALKKGEQAKPPLLAAASGLFLQQVKY